MTAALPRPPSASAHPAAAVAAAQGAALAMLRYEMLALGRLLPCRTSDEAADAQREARHAEGMEEAFDDVPV